MKWPVHVYYILPKSVFSPQHNKFMKKIEWEYVNKNEHNRRGREGTG